MKWDLKVLRGHVERLFGEEQLRTVNQCLRTIGDRREFSRYHFNEAKGRMEGALQGRETFELTAALLGAFDTDDRQFSTARFQAYAHTVACVQNMHAVVDNMVHFAYYVLGVNLDPATRIEKERDITWSKVGKKLVAGPIKDGLSALLDDPGFTYLAALSNHSKHRSIVEVSYSVNFESDAVEHGLRFNSFTYDGVTYPTKWVRPTLIDEYQRQEGLILTIGNAVNDELRDRS
ncbi:hypothetical protein [Stenotrophomonas maltophilia]|uniref:hypothetical protein n=1 Tax=Stenotrophomonas maltophilia TaxID=40324 RepID=UPI000C25EE45|nr:hypothetical protein [Stenotrophomonas maltophilia]PJL06183.1 hypothetical protein B9Y63_02975 [Stenotrophomonas maltophilia]